MDIADIVSGKLEYYQPLRKSKFLGVCLQYYNNMFNSLGLVDFVISIFFRESRHYNIITDLNGRVAFH